MIARLFFAGVLCAVGTLAQTPVHDLIEGGHYKRARAAAEAKHKETPNDAETLCLMSIVRQEFGKADEAEKYAAQAVALNPKEARYHFQLSEVVGQRRRRACCARSGWAGNSRRRLISCCNWIRIMWVG